MFAKNGEKNGDKFTQKNKSVWLVDVLSSLVLGCVVLLCLVVQA